MSSIRDLADEYVERWAAADPVSATGWGVPGHDQEMTDYSPDGLEARAAIVDDIRRRVTEATAADDRDRVARDYMLERLGVAQEMWASGEHLRPLRVIGSPVQSCRQCFDLMPRSTADDWETIATRLERVPDGLSSIRLSLEEGRRRGLLAARRQAVACAEQAETWSGQGGRTPFFTALVGGAEVEAALTRRLTAGAETAQAAYADLGRYLIEEYAPAAPETDAVGPDRYRLFARSFTGADLDLDEAYAWGWDELHRIEREMDETAELIAPGIGVEKVKELLETDPARAIEGEDNLRRWLQDLMDRTIEELDGTHFDIAPPIKRVEAMIAPPGGAAAMYYTGPSEDFSRPGRTWYPTLGKTRFPLWGEVSVAYHEGVPGHHLQVAQVRYLRDTLTRYQRLVFVSGHGEGWALYAERLMDELGYLDNPDYRLGYLRAQAMRAVRVVADIGMHLELPIPKDERFHPGERWTPELGRDFLVQRAHFPADFMESELIRYLGMAAQAISYKVGERVWLDVREAAMMRDGDSFDLKEFHRRALDAGPMGLDQLRRELARA